MKKLIIFSAGAQSVGYLATPDPDLSRSLKAAALVPCKM
jgi:hypothetical protein